MFEHPVAGTCVVKKMPQAHRRLIIEFVKGEAVDWSNVGLSDMSGLPAIMWRRQNLDKLSDKRRAEIVELLERALS